MPNRSFMQRAFIIAIFYKKQAPGVQQLFTNKKPYVNNCLHLRFREKTDLF
jgi:hypothetical protein